MAHLKHDPIMADIVHAEKIGYFQRLNENGPCEASSTPVEVLYARTKDMTPERRRAYLASISGARGGKVKLSGGRRSKRTRLWLSRDGPR